MTEHTLLEPAAETVRTFNNLLAEKGLTYYICDRLVGEMRHGVIGIRAAGAANVFARAIDREEYARSSSIWSSGDASIGRPRTGSPKHRALLALVARIQAVEPAQPAEERQPGQALYEDCDCEFDPYSEEPNEEESWHYLRTCRICSATWFSTHCPHDGIQRPCPNGHVNRPFGAPK